MPTFTDHPRPTLRCWTTPAGTSLSGMSDEEATDLMQALDRLSGDYQAPPIIDRARVILRRALGNVLPLNHAPIVTGPPPLPGLTPLGPVDLHDGHAEAEAAIGNDPSPDGC